MGRLTLSMTLRDGERLAGAGDAEEDLMLLARRELRGQLRDRCGLIALRLEWRYELEGAHREVGDGDGEGGEATPLTP